MAVVTISREFGSEGDRIAQKVAEGLGYHLADKSTIEKILLAYGMVDFDANYEKVPGFWGRFDLAVNQQRSDFLRLLNQSLATLARHGDAVLVGRGGFAVLAGFADVLNVRIQAPLALRISRVKELPSIGSFSLAEAAVKDNDRLQEKFIESTYGLRWDAADAFDLVIDTGKTSADLAANLVVDVVRALEGQKPAGRKTTAEIRVDPVLASAVQDVLHCHQASHGAGFRPLAQVPGP